MPLQFRKTVFFAQHVLNTQNSKEEDEEMPELWTYEIRRHTVDTETYMSTLQTQFRCLALDAVTHKNREAVALLTKLLHPTSKIALKDLSNLLERMQAEYPEWVKVKKDFTDRKEAVAYKFTAQNNLNRYAVMSQWITFEDILEPLVEPALLTVGNYLDLEKAITQLSEENKWKLKDNSYTESYAQLLKRMTALYTYKSPVTNPKTS